MLYLAQFTLCRQDYPDNESEEQVTRLVEASNERGAEDKLVRHYEGESEPYCVSYTVTNLILSPTIE